MAFPPTLYEVCHKPRGLVLVTGPTGSGKSTTLAALIDEINRTRAEHIITIEDPIEFLHRHKRCIVNQRELGPDATSFAEALRGALRQDPDVILLGEMRDLETISTALTAAETGHLVFATLHTQDAASTVDRVIDVFPAGQQGQIRTQLAGTLEGVIAQTLLPTADGQGRVAAIEVLAPDDAVRNLIRQAKIEQVYSIMQTGGKKGMQTMEQALAELVLRGIITEEVALARSSRARDAARPARSSGRRRPERPAPLQGRGGLDHGLQERDQAQGPLPKRGSKAATDVRPPKQPKPRQAEAEPLVCPQGRRPPAKRRGAAERAARSSKPKRSRRS